MRYRVFQVATLSFWVEIDDVLWVNHAGVPRSFSTRAQALEAALAASTGAAS